MPAPLRFDPEFPDVFPDDYTGAREAWRLYAGRLPAPSRVQSFDAPGAAPDGSPLATDSAWLGPASASRVLVVIGGTHGIEGFAGSGVLYDLLGRLTAAGLSGDGDFAVLAVHALTPWGYAWHRRCDHDGIDLNRNFADFDAPPANPGYEVLRDAVFDPDPAVRERVFAAFAASHGNTAFEVAISGGQYSDPAGPFYGGAAPAHGRRVIEQLMQDYRLAGRRLAVVDVHTGLGPYGYGEIICDHAPGSPGAATARRWYGDACAMPALGTSHSVVKSGLLDYAWHAIMDDDSCFVTLEFGTLATGSLFEVLLRDHQLWANGVPDTARRERQARAMLAHFFPADPAWREAVLFRARQVIGQAVAGLLS